MSGRFIAVIGPSGVGKDSVMEGIAAIEPRIVLARRVITRPSEAGGEVFDGVNASTFEKMRNNGRFALWWTAHGLQYGIPIEVEAELAAGNDVLANLSRSMLQAGQERFPRFDVISLTAEKEVLRDRLTNRGRESAEDIENRLGRMGCSMPEGVQAYALDNSGSLDTTVSRALELLYPVRA